MIYLFYFVNVKVQIKHKTTMLITAKAARYLSAIALGTIAVSFATLPTKAQSNTSESFNFEQIDVEEEIEFDFLGENETISVEDELQNLEEYSISESDDFDGKLIEENKNRANKGAQPRYRVNTEIYSY